MNREDIIRTAQEAGMVHDEDDDSFFSPSNLGMDVHINNLKRFAAIVAALEAKDEPVGYFSVNDYGNWEENESNNGIPLYTTPPQRTWIGLTDEEIRLQWSEFWEAECHPWAIDFAQAIEAKLRSKNNG